MTNKMMTQLRFPIGEFEFPKEYSKPEIDKWINTIETFPRQLQLLTQHLSTLQLNWKYRPDGWAIKQVVHHCADSHMNSLIRFKLTLTEDNPIIRPYLEDKWAELVDGNTDDISSSQMLLTGLHERWTFLLKSLNNSDLKRVFIHPEHNWKITLEQTIALYAWHCEHHLAHIKNAIESAGKYN